MITQRCGATSRTTADFGDSLALLLHHELIFIPHPPDGRLWDFVTQLGIEMFHSRSVTVLQSKLSNFSSQLITVLNITTPGYFLVLLLHLSWFETLGGDRGS